jgi:signal transduction histidine kinase/predicted RNA-binding protein with RPS1 domain/DNA-binding NarL/FixJ family response regulator
MSTDKGNTYQINQIVAARVERILPFGVFVRLPDGTQAYVRKRELTQAGNLDPRQVVSEGQEIKAAVIALAEPDRNLELSARQAERDPWDKFVQSFKVRDTVTATVKRLSAKGVLAQIVPGVDGFIPLTELAPWLVEQPYDLLWGGDQVEAMIIHLDRQAKRMRLSIRQQMIHMVQVQQFTEHFQIEEALSEPTTEPDEPDVRGEELTDLQALGQVLVLEDHSGVREELVIWLKRHGCQADGVSLPNDGLERMKQTEYGLALVDLDLAGQDGLEFIRSIQKTSPNTRVVVMSIPDWLAERSQDLEALQVVEVFVKPLDLDEVLEILARLARGETVGPFRLTVPGQVEETADSFQQLAKTMRSGIPLVTRLEAGLKGLVRFTRAELGVLFRLDPLSHQVDVVAQAGHLPLNYEAVYDLSGSPVKDLILEGGEIFETQLSVQARRRFQKLLEVVSFETCLGVPVSAAGRVEHALFLFHREPDAFTRYRLRDAQAMATLLGVALESQALEERIHAVSPFVLSGRLAAGFGHDVFNKMSALELQVRNLRASFSTLTGEAGVSHLAEASGGIQMVHQIDSLLEVTLDLKQTVEAFRELIRAEDRVAVDVNQVVQRAVLLLQAIARRRRVHIEMALASDLPPIIGSAVRLQQVFLNVMLNAVQHIAQKLERWPGCQGALHIATAWEPKEECPVRVRFTDNGPGIHRQLWENIFALGFSTRPGGTGLGLFIARSLVESMGGRIAVEESRIPLGTTFLAELPAVEV